MLYKKPSFSVPASSGTAETCERWGHTMPDTKGKCVRCGVPVVSERASQLATLPSGIDSEWVGENGG